MKDTKVAYNQIVTPQVEALARKFVKGGVSGNRADVIQQVIDANIIINFLVGVKKLGSREDYTLAVESFNKHLNEVNRIGREGSSPSPTILRPRTNLH